MTAAFRHRFSHVARQIVALGLCYTCWFSCAWGQSLSIQPVKPAAPVLWRPYLAPDVPPIRLINSTRLQDLIRAGSLYLTVQDAIALVLENNIDIEVARYIPFSRRGNLSAPRPVELCRASPAEPRKRVLSPAAKVSPEASRPRASLPLVGTMQPIGPPTPPSLRSARLRKLWTPLSRRQPSSAIHPYRSLMPPRA